MPLFLEIYELGCDAAPLGEDPVPQLVSELSLAVKLVMMIFMGVVKQCARTARLISLIDLTNRNRLFPFGPGVAEVPKIPVLTYDGAPEYREIVQKSIDFPHKDTARSKYGLVANGLAPIRDVVVPIDGSKQ